MSLTTSRTAVLLLVGLFAIGVAGCTSSTSGSQGSLFFPYSEDLKQSLDELVKLEVEVAAQIDVWSVADVEKHILSSSRIAREKGSHPEPLPERYATINAQGKLVTKTWRFAPISVRTMSVPVVSWRDASNVGFMLSATEYNGKLAEVKTSFVPMPESSVSYSTKDAILLGVGAGAILFLMSP